MNLKSSDKEILTAYLRNPSASAEEIAEVLGMSKWTVSKSKRRLIDSGILRFIRVPDFSTIGAGLLFSGFGAVRSGDTKKTEYILPETLFFSSFEDTKGFGIGISRDYTHFYRELMSFSEMFWNLDADRYGFTLLPVEMTDIWRNADFYPLISSEYGIEVPLMDEEIRQKPYSFKAGEEKVYIELWNTRAGRERGLP